MARKNKILKAIIERWPLVAIAVGIVLSIIWIAILIWIPIYIASII